MCTTAHPAAAASAVRQARGYLPSRKASLGTEAHGYEQPARSRYEAAPRPAGFEPLDRKSSNNALQL